MYQYVAILLPRSVRMSYKNLLNYCDIKIDSDRFLGFLILFGFGISFVISFMLFLFTSTVFLFDFILTYIVFEIAVYAWLSLTASKRAKFVEEILPDALQLMAMNIKAGLTTERALLASARPEFGQLETEIRRAGKQILAGKDVKYALLDIPKRVKSRTLEKTMRLVVEGIESGGELSDLLQQTAEDIQTRRIAESEVKANVLMYAIFIFFAAGIGAPLLLGISTYLVETLSYHYARFEIPEIQTQGFNIARGQISVSSNFLFLFSIASLIITGIFGSLIIGLVKDGEEKQGVKYIPILLLISLSIFLFVRFIVSGILGVL